MNIRHNVVKIIKLSEEPGFNIIEDQNVLDSYSENVRYWFENGIYSLSTEWKPIRDMSTDDMSFTIKTMTVTDENDRDYHFDYVEVRLKNHRMSEIEPWMVGDDTHMIDRRIDDIVLTPNIWWKTLHVRNISGDTVMDLKAICEIFPEIIFMVVEDNVSYLNDDMLYPGYMDEYKDEIEFPVYDETGHYLPSIKSRIRLMNLEGMVFEF